MIRMNYFFPLKSYEYYHQYRYLHLHPHLLPLHHLNRSLTTPQRYFQTFPLRLNRHVLVLRFLSDWSFCLFLPFSRYELFILPYFCRFINHQRSANWLYQNLRSASLLFISFELRILYTHRVNAPQNLGFWIYQHTSHNTFWDLILFSRSHPCIVDVLALTQPAFSQNFRALSIFSWFFHLVRFN